MQITVTDYNAVIAGLKTQLALQVEQTNELNSKLKFVRSWNRDDQREFAQFRRELKEANDRLATATSLLSQKGLKAYHAYYNELERLNAEAEDNAPKCCEAKPMPEPAILGL